ncbi:MAG: Crp/Fnr family transcriptional regulator [Flavobacterium sp.]|jgi:CRP/FNR family transcriptional regulator|nr:Crp/Fnr family transcriptional regulator [Flavobacterium sp.]
MSNEENKYWYLRDHQLFKKLNAEQLNQLCVLVNYKKAKKGELIYFSSAETPRIFLLKKGHIKLVSTDADGNETLNDVIRSGDLFGDLSLSASPEGGEQAIALSDQVVICSFLLADFEQLLVKYPNLALTYTKWVGLKLIRLHNSYANLVSKDAKTRLLLFLKEWAIREGKFQGNDAIIDNYLTQADIAQLICTSRQTTTQLFHELENQGKLQYSRSSIWLTDYKSLN